ncbi:hypothetical protein PW52_11540 [Tamlana sedimentorum]|uniref:STAS/SEC14 domain-containing protein n=1 Tax=Neotamlana sedimentorum TaxID=1435349 RepID=A0A0D7W870_9FLAO|nr:hypothetical protein [Tamlana sedimentorum]KJD35291.1 hypothetical protein PW52_11540 [Tamlana sedimentorum]
MITSEFNEQTNILETELNGEVDAVDVLLYLNEFKSNKALPRKLKTLVTGNRVKFKFSVKDLKDFNDVKNQSLQQYTTVASAVVINNPIGAALSTIYGAIANNEKYKYKVFSTREAALLWLNNI